MNDGTKDKLEIRLKMKHCPECDRPMHWKNNRTLRCITCGADWVRITDEEIREATKNGI